jgi:glycosyltransferase involved in cell wall biosynthesis
MTGPHEAVLDARWLRTGIGRYILTLLHELKRKIPRVRLTCITLPEHVAAVAPHCDRVVPLACGIYTLSEQLRLPLICREAAVFCSPHYNVPVLRRGSLVVTVHDITHLIYPGYARRMRSLFYAEPMLRIARKRASHIITPSNYTRKMLVERLHADPEKISVVPCAVHNVFQLQDKTEAAATVRRAHGIHRPYMLYVGTAAPHKNLRGLLEAYCHLRSRKPGTPALVLVLSDGRHSLHIDEHLRFLMARPGVHCLGAVTDASLAALYAAACMTILPSFEEGFGLPMVESMACGTPVLCSNTASLPEIAGDAALYFAPDSIEDIAGSIEKLLDCSAMQQKLSAAGLQRAAMYSASNAAIGYASVLSSVIDRQR